jgi:hypothetical protein
LQNDVQVISFTIGGIDAPLLGRQCIIPYAGNCSIVRDIKKSVSRIITTMELILKSISSVWQSSDEPLEKFVKLCRLIHISMVLTFSPTFTRGELPATISPSFAFKSIAQLRYLTFSMVYIPVGRAIVVDDGERTVCSSCSRWRIHDPHPPVIRVF